MNAKTFFLAAVSKLLVLGGLVVFFGVYVVSSAQGWWKITAIDTMKYSRDLAREYANRSMDDDLDAQMQVIADTGATHVAIATPYDDEFSVTLEKWVAAARKHQLKVWFRGNWAGWEEWFEYEPISREQHIEKTRQFILDNSELFEDGDIFTACPECENGGPGDPRQRGDTEEYRQFLIEEHEVMVGAFTKIKKDVQVNVNSMNGDVARLIMDKKTTKALGGVVAIDHYVETPEQLAEDVEGYAEQSEGKVFLGEMGAPIPDIHGSMTQAEQAQWLDETLMLLAKSPNVEGINYWTAWDGSTALWDGNNRPRQAVEVLKKYYNPETLDGKIISSTNKVVAQASVTAQMKAVTSDDGGNFSLPYLEKAGNVIITHPEYFDKVVSFAELEDGVQIVLEPREIGFVESIVLWLKSVLEKFRN